MIGNIGPFSRGGCLLGVLLVVSPLGGCGKLKSQPVEIEVRNETGQALKIITFNQRRTGKLYFEAKDFPSGGAKTWQFFENDPDLCSLTVTLSSGESLSGSVESVKNGKQVLFVVRPDRIDSIVRQEGEFAF